MPFASVNGVKLHYRIDRAASADAPWLVFSNSLGADLSMWAAQIAALRARFNLLRYDTRGHGHSDVPPGPYTIDQLAGDVIGLLDHLGIERAHFCGISMGGLTGAALAARHPRRLGRVVLANTGAKIGTPEVWEPRAAKARDEGMHALVDAVLPRWFKKEFFAAEPRLVDVVRDTFVHHDNHGYAANCEALNTADLREDVKGITLPVLVVTGAHDTSTPPELGRALAAAIPGARHVEFDAAHISNIECADGFNRALLDFLTA
ncbi:3-oxoadipate enol-lactonase [Burkholderia plantarii]|uniref:3-oxoadipate enol-lactonase n=1 Tax=Burkholderia plantarii TaxID=41899 RepID=UPI0006D8B1A6|nr:3-oxoadipate enol-lactonase [Burkholderia plantarii]ALK32369.1 3-oxoadipate enol-lactonase [Burkholderia plantarii]WLE61493.1 3-oxoadipate enol-lactonase [Burkholderia plantarii]GLZ18912.1 3-oxoadipate enol-lactonase [Burkholderia plantarii]